MALVFVAHDQTLGRDVVIKILMPDLAVTLNVERFTREIKLVARLQQANIVPVLSAGTVGALPYYCMPFIEGQSVRQRLKRAPPPSIQESVRILCDIARALEFAHDRGVVHRDIKPENVLLSGGTAVVTDFGIAKAVDAAQKQLRSPTLTGRGTSIGTPGYMAPEQAAGDEVDGRADIYAWGVVAYELIAGTHPFFGKRTAQQLIAAQIAETPRPIDEMRRNIPAALSSLITRALAKEPADRPQSAKELLETLDDPGAMGAKSNRRMVVLAAIAALLLIAAIAFCQSGSAIGSFDLGRPPADSSFAAGPA